MQDPLSLLLSQDPTMGKKTVASASTYTTARQTRRRTSPEDQAVLEAAFKENPKPDKALRTDLSRRVSMSEKELSIWFQNKRQVARRRSRPMTSEDVSLALQSSQTSTDSYNDHHALSSQDVLSGHGSQTPGTSQSTADSTHKASSIHEGTTIPSSNKSEVQDAASPGIQDKPHLSRSDETPIDSNTAEKSAPFATAGTIHNDPLALKSKTSKAKCPIEDVSFMVHDDSQHEVPAPSDNVSAVARAVAPFKRTISQPRLCTSLDGSVRVKTGVSPSPSPPRPNAVINGRQPRVAGQLQRSQSAIIPSSSSDLRTSSSFGRSRDSRTWEFYCDREIRDELTKNAEKEKTGSAAGAIALMRSGSKTSLPSPAAMTTVPNKRSSTGSGKSASQKRLKADDAKKTSKPKLARASSSVARLQTTTSTSNIHKTAGLRTKAIPIIDVKRVPKVSKKKSSVEIYEDGNDSDKENWAPGTQVSVSPHPHRAARPPASHSAILRENTSVPSIATALGHGINTGNIGRYPRKENESSDEDGDYHYEVLRFMHRGGSGDEEDLAGVQGLLSLSQGLWR
ncbi:MAG: hypothetical protein LQ338_002554 [Usnochroma carphineum]|nr:MAG: hypothetical protein LQ338_002554 [Usnochroma carphineum]